ncbi:vacuolar protein sorting-associated protein 13C-like [Myripristis murdjan]|uniref:vacuolar protein sorting-associated protein 13C-like n=1 Tax=Myripristis murdjan TaxID=586833 RepID=UPI0011763E61|nr:vacuolar protein sorting-associated protein 13C-like [Myripristis murdjan]
MIDGCVSWALIGLQVSGVLTVCVCVCVCVCVFTLRGPLASQTGDFLFNLESVVYKEPQNVAKGCKKSKKHKKGFRKLKRHEHKAEKPQEEKKDSFAEKLATQVIKNLQVKISSIHLRYEDDLSDPKRPLSMGVTLSELSLQTADENWKTCILNEAAKIIYKLGRLECLCAYWNVGSPVLYRGDWQDVLDQLKAGISSSQQELQRYQYIFKPIFASAKMCINPNAELELKSPKANLHLEVQNIAIEMTKPQYLSMIELLESVDCMVKNGPYRKFRPDVPVHRHARLWWQYGVSSILEVHIRRFNRMWSWSNIRQHRDNLKAYKTAYKTKLLTPSKLSPDTERLLQDLEKVLDVFNITLVRQQAQMEVIRSGQRPVGRKAAGGKQAGGGGGGFFSSFFGRRAKKEEQEQEESKEPESLDELMTSGEKEKLYTAIGYSGSSHNLALPKQYVAYIVTFKLFRTSITVREEPNVPEILKVQMIDLSTRISQRPGAQAFRVEVALEHWYVTGLEQQGAVPSLIASLGDSASSLLSVQFEVNPEDGGADQLLHVQSQPVEIIYDALTVNSMVEFFKTDRGVDLEVLTSATLSKLEEIKEKTATGLSHIIETRKVLQLSVDLKPSYLLLPQSGFYHDHAHLIILDFGSLQLSSVEPSGQQPASSSFSSLEEIMDRAYERYTLQLRSVQLLYSKSGEAWKAARQQGSTLQHILQPMDFSVQLAKCMVEKDARMPRFKVSGELPLLHVKISDQKIQGVLELLDSIPLPRPSSAPSTPTGKALPLAEARPRALSLPPALLSAADTDSDEDASEKSLDEEHQRSAGEELTELHFKFEVKAVLLELTRQADQEKTVLAFSVSQLGAEGRMRSFDLSVTAYLRRIALDYCEAADARKQPLHLISSSDQQGSDLLKVEYIRADPSGPSFQTMFDSTEQTLKVEFSSLDFLLHTKALLNTINYLNSAVPQRLMASRDGEAKKQVEKAGQGKTDSRGSRDGSVFSFKLFAMLGCFHVEVCDDRRSIADIRVQGIDASVAVQAKETEVFARLRDIVVTDVDPKTIHKKAVSIVGEEVFSFKLSLFPAATEGRGYSDMSKVDGKVTMRLGCIQIVYLHKFLMSLLMFVDNFQTAKEALSAATAQAAEKAASSVRDLAQKSFRLSMDIKLKAPLIIIPSPPSPTMPLWWTWVSSRWGTASPCSRLKVFLSLPWWRRWT